MMFDVMCMVRLFFFKQKTAYEMRISDWSSDVCSSDLTKNRLPNLASGFRNTAGLDKTEDLQMIGLLQRVTEASVRIDGECVGAIARDRKSTRLNSSH